jgi:hypothetical protein
MKCYFVDYTLIDSVTYLSPLKWKTDQNKMKFRFIESLSFQCELFKGKSVKVLFFSYLSPSRIDVIVVPTEP